MPKILPEPSSFTELYVVGKKLLNLFLVELVTASYIPSALRLAALSTASALRSFDTAVRFFSSP